MLDAITNYLGSLNPSWLYLTLFTSAYIENIFPPIPGDTVVVFAAYFTGRSEGHFLGVFVSTTLGSVSGFMTYYALGRLIGKEYFLQKDFRFLPAASFRKAGEWFTRYGYWVLLLNRFLSGVRSVISIVSGIYGLPWYKVLAIALLSCALWNGALIWAGYLLGANWRLIEEILAQYNRVILTLLLAMAVVWFARRRLSRRTTR